MISLMLVAAIVYRCPGDVYQDFPCVNGREIALTYDRTPAPIYVPPISSYYEPSFGGYAINVGPGRNVYLHRGRRR